MKKYEVLEQSDHLTSRYLNETKGWTLCQILDSTCACVEGYEFDTLEEAEKFMNAHPATLKKIYTPTGVRYEGKVYQLIENEDDELFEELRLNDTKLVFTPNGRITSEAEYKDTLEWYQDITDERNRLKEMYLDGYTLYEISGYCDLFESDIEEILSDVIIPQS